MSRHTEYTLQDIPEDIKNKKAIVRSGRKVINAGKRGAISVYKGLVGKKYTLVMVPENQDEIPKEEESERPGLSTQED